jgi:hypothetical protein
MCHLISHAGGGLLCVSRVRYGRIFATNTAPTSTLRASRYRANALKEHNNALVIAKQVMTTEAVDHKIEP